MTNYEKELFENQSDIIFVKEGEKIVDANKSFFKLFSNLKSIDEIKGKKLSICRFFTKEKGFIYHTDDAKWIEFVLKHPKHTHRAKIQKGRNSFIFKLEVIEGSDSLTIIILKNISEIQTYKDGAAQLSAMLDENEALLRQYKKALETSAIVSYSNLDGLITSVNRNFVEITGYSEKEIKNKPHTILKHPDVPAAIYKDVLQTVQAKGIWQGILKNIKKDKGSFYTNSFIVPLLDKDNNIQEYLSIRQDVTNLIKAQAKAKNADYAKSIFLANMSYEIIEPLKKIKEFSNQLITSTNLSATEREEIETIDNRTQHLINIVKDIIDYTSYEKGDVELESKEVLFEDELNSIIKKHTPIATRRGVTLTLSLGDDLPQRVKTDSPKIKQVLSNLIDNAIKFTNEDGIVDLSVELTHTYVNGCSIKFSVIDSGIGIKDENFSQIFEPFIQVESPIIDNYQGTGLGLAISKAIVDELNGELKVESQIDRGSSFSFELNFEVITKKDIKKVVKETKKKTKSAFSGKVLVVDDNQVNRKLMEILIQKRGIELELAVDGKDALDRAIASKFDLILMDINMPTMGGIESMQKIKEYEKTNNISPRTTLVSLSANVSRSDSDGYRAAGFVDCLTKPLREKDLDEKLKHYLPKGETTNVQEEVTNSIETEDNAFEIRAKELELDMDFLKDLIKMFFDEIEDESPKFKFAIETIDFRSIKYHAHKIKGSSLNLKLDDIAFVATDLEICARDRSLVDYDKKYAKLRKAMKQTEEEFNRI